MHSLIHLPCTSGHVDLESRLPHGPFVLSSFIHTSSHGLVELSLIFFMTFILWLYILSVDDDEMMVMMVMMTLGGLWVSAGSGACCRVDGSLDGWSVCC